MERLAIVTQLPAAVRRTQAFGEHVENLHARRLVAAGLCTAALQDEQQQAKRDGFWRLGMVHLLGVPCSRFFRALMHAAHRGAIRDDGYRIAFGKYHAFRLWMGAA